MDASSELGKFLRSRRAQLQPDDVGMVTYGARRRVPGLRREELAQLAGVSAAYYTRLEQGQSRNASEGVLDAIARALRLSEVERAHLYDLARPSPSRRRSPVRAETVRPSLRQLLDTVDQVPAVVVGRRNDVLAWNALGHALLAGHLDRASPERATTRPSLVRMLFLDPHTRELFPSWDVEARGKVAFLRLVAGRHPDDSQLATLIGELTLKSPEFADLWRRRRVSECTSGEKQFHHPLVGPMTLSFEVLVAPDAPDQQLMLYSAEPDSPSFAALRLLSRLVADVAGPSADVAGTAPRQGPRLGSGPDLCRIRHGAVPEAARPPRPNSAR